MTPKIRPDADVDSIVAAVHRRYPDLSVADIEKWAQLEAKNYRDVRIRQFVPILVARAVADRARQVAGSPG